jgi:hypothetical protein
VSPKAWRGLALDGKTLKGAWEEVDTGAGKVRLFSALTHAEGVVVGQRRIPDNTGEQAQMIPLLDQLAGAKPGNETPADLSGVVVTADALCRYRHKASYADYRIMPSVVVKMLVNGVTTAEWSA